VGGDSWCLSQFLGDGLMAPWVLALIVIAVLLGIGYLVDLPARRRRHGLAQSADSGPTGDIEDRARRNGPLSGWNGMTTPPL
jgi:hypothetical protein